MIVLPGKRNRLQLLSQTSQVGHKNVLESGLICTDTLNGQMSHTHLSSNQLLSFLRPVGEQVEAIPKTLHVHNLLLGTGDTG
jgi:hypothetical protein